MDAVTTQVPAPVPVKVVAETVQGPLTLVNVTAPVPLDPELESDALSFALIELGVAIAVMV
jgi:hypothetical protein